MTLGGTMNPGPQQRRRRLRLGSPVERPLRALLPLATVCTLLGGTAAMVPARARAQEPQQPLVDVSVGALGLGIGLTVGGSSNPAKPASPPPGNGAELPVEPKGAGDPDLPEAPVDVSQVKVTDLSQRRPDPAVLEGLRRELDRPDERVQVIVQLRMRWVPEAALGERQRGAQEATIRLLQDGIIRALPAPTVVHRYQSLPSMALLVNRRDLDTLALAPQVSSIDTVRSGSLLDKASGERAHYNQAQMVGFDGQGWAVAIVDSGVKRDHEYLAGRVAAEACFAHHVDAQGNVVGDCPNKKASQTGEGAAAPCVSSVCGHGTEVAGIAAGQDPPGGEAVGNGVAPKASIVAVQIARDEFRDCNGDGVTGWFESCASIDEADVLAALDWLYGTRKTFSLAAVNLSFGLADPQSTTCDGTAMKPAVDQLAAAGVATVIAAGNDERRDAVSYPACISTAVTVGMTNNKDKVSADSNASTFMDLWAPGVGVRTSDLGGKYESATGTSISAPLVTGAFALLRQMRGCSSMSGAGTPVDQMLRSLIDTGESVTDDRPADPADNLPAGSVTKPRVDVYGATHTADFVENSPWASATPINGMDGSVRGTNWNATKEAFVVVAEPNHGNNRGGASVWYEWRAPATGRVRFTTMESSFDTLLAAYRAPDYFHVFGEPVAQNDDAGGTTRSMLEFDATANSLYYIAVDGYRYSWGPCAARGAIKLSWAQNRPPNDDFSAPRYAVGQMTGSSLQSTAEFGEPSPATPSVWFNWVGGSGGSSGLGIFNTAGSGFDTILDVYQGTSLKDLVLVATDDDSGSGNASIVRFRATEGQRYFVRLRGYAGATGSYVVTASG